MPDDPELPASTTWLRLARRDVPLVAGPRALERLPDVLSDAGFQGRLWVVADARAASLHGDRLARLFAADVLRIAGDEPNKTIQAVEGVWDWLVERGVQRNDGVVAFGGGVICDLVGFAAACYLRGIALVNVPTTLLAQVDASVGGKTGVDHERGKNLIGAYYQPIAVIADTAFLATLSPRSFRAGLAEVIKIAMALDGAFFQRLERVADGLKACDAAELGPVVRRAIELKAEIVERDEREAGERMVLNYGHTIGHALEAASGYEALLHGEAVAIGMEAAAFLAVRLGMLAPEDAERQRTLLERCGLPVSLAEALDIDDVLARLEHDKKRTGDRQRWVLAERVGSARVRDDVPSTLVRDAIASVAPRRAQAGGGDSAGRVSPE